MEIAKPFITLGGRAALSSVDLDKGNNEVL